MAEVVRTVRVTPHLVRVVLGGDGLAGFAADQFTDHYVKLLFPPADAPYAVPFDVERVRAELPPESWPATRTYTVRAWDAEAGELTIDVVHHGQEGLAGPWAAAARPGERIQFLGPGGAYAPSPDADWHLLVGDDSALPAIAATVRRLPTDRPARVFVEVPTAADEQDLGAGRHVDLVWVHRADRAPGTALLAAVLSAELPEGVVQAFVHGEAGLVRDVRRHLRAGRTLTPELTSISGYWRRGRTEDRWQAEKKAWNAEVAAEEAPLVG